MPLNRGVLPHHVLASPRLGPGSPGREQLFALLSDEARACFSAPVLPSAWIDERFSVELHRAVRIVLDLRDDEAFKDYYRKATTVSYSRVYKMLLAFLSPPLLLSRAPSVWRRQHDSGDLVVDEVKDGSARGRVLGHPFTAEPEYGLVIVAGMEAVMGLTGAKPVRGARRVVRPDLVEFDLTWTPR